MNALIQLILYYPSVVVVALAIPLICLRWFTVPSDRKRTEWLLVSTALVVPAGALAQGAANTLTLLKPLKYDLYVFRIDALFGEPSFHLGQLTANHLWLKDVVSVSYGLLPSMVILTLATYLYLRSETEFLFTVRVFAINLFASIAFYLLFPVSGPAFAFQQFPRIPDQVLPHMVAINAAPNGVPSVHTSSALLILFFLSRWKVGRLIGGIFLMLTVLATMGSGQHYFFDLLCAAPYACGVVWVSHRLWQSDAVDIRSETAQYA